MYTIKYLRQLWRRRGFLAAVGVLAVFAGMAVWFKLPSLQSRSYKVAVATGQILLDTRDSQVVALAPPKGSETLGVRANMLATLLVGGTLESTIAQQAGLHPSQLIGMTDAATLGSPASGGSSPLPSQTPLGPDAYVLTTHTLTDSANDPLPIIEFSAQGPTTAAAMRLANAAISGLREYLDAKAAAEQISNAGRVQVTGVGVSQATPQSRGPTPLMAIAAVILVFGLGCAAIVGFPMLARTWREAEAFEDQDSDAAAADHEVEPGAVRDDAAQSPVSAVGSPGVGIRAVVDRPVTAVEGTLDTRRLWLGGATATPASEGDLRATQRPAAPDDGPAAARRLAAARAERDRAQQEWLERQARNGG